MSAIRRSITSVFGWPTVERSATNCRFRFDGATSS